MCANILPVLSMSVVTLHFYLNVLPTLRESPSSKRP